MSAALRNSEELARRLAIATDRERRSDVNDAIDHLTRGFRVLTEVGGVPTAALLDVIGGTLDILSDLQHDMDVALDEIRQWAGPLDRAELQEIYAKLRARRTA